MTQINGNQASPSFETQMNNLLRELDKLIEVIQSTRNSEGEAALEIAATVLDPDADFETTSSNLVDYKRETENFLIALKDVNFPGGAIQYVRITQRVFTDTLGFEAVEYIVEKIKESVESNFSDMLFLEEDLSRKCYKLLDHLLLASFQLGEITKHTREQTQNLTEELRKSEKKYEGSSKKLEEMQNNIKNELTKIYVQFVTILGIFTAVVVSIFGGLELINGAFKHLHQASLWRVTLTISLFSIAILCMLSLLTNWVSAIVHRLFDSTYKPSLKQYVIHNGAFATGIFIFSYIAIVSAVFNSSKFRTQITKTIDVWGSLPIIILLAIPLLIGVGVFLKTIDFRAYKKDQDSH